MRIHIRFALIGAGMAAIAAAPLAARAQTAISEQEAHDISVDAYLYLYPLVSLDLTRRQSIQPGADGPGKAPSNTFSNVPEYPPAAYRGVVRPNFDTLYSVAWLDLTHEPVVISVPPTGDRYFLLPMLDMWSDVFASPGTRTTGNAGGTFLIAPQGWRPELNARLAEEFRLPKDVQRIDAPTPYVWVIGRTKTDGPSDYDAVHKIQAGYKITPLSQWGREPSKPAASQPDPTLDAKTPPKQQADSMPGELYFAYGAELMKVNPPHATDQPIIARMKRIGVSPGESLDASKLDANVRKAMASAPQEAQRLMAWKVATLARVVNGWSMNTDTMGVYGNYYLKRAMVAQLGLGANLPEDAIYPLNIADGTGRPLSGESKYTIHFDKASLPPVNAFWSVTLYDREGFAAPNAINRQAVSSWMPFKYNADGSLDLIIQNEPPGKGMETNWLPAPKTAFNLTMRLYSPRSDALTGKWNPPPVMHVEEMMLVGQ
jgi:hypothetical protein